MPFSRTSYWPSNRSMSWSLTPTYLMSLVISINPPGPTVNVFGVILYHWPGATPRSAWFSSLWAESPAQSD